ncbi:MAG TPA: ferritin family protein [Candidatus Rifleibacterium sp.]|nr:ferritin family protein [Candidatus Rifleibacterium sp.]HPT45663.1 ferritin family protein [Candidatus Rifleibacterium sp.]
MSVERSLDIIKQALLLEKRGKSFYSKVAEHTEHASVRDFFETMAEEEQGHIHALLKQYKAMKENGRFAAGSFDESADIRAAADQVINQDIISKINGADYESAAISAAISMEERAVKVYSERAESAIDPEEKKLYTWLSRWERAHLHQLLEIDRIVSERIWADNNFWPF